MKCISKLFYLALIFALAISSIHAVPKETDESRKLKAESADKHIRFISPAEFSVHINKGLWIIMFGAKWCKYTQRLTPKWLGLQTRIRAENLAKDINIAKVECSKNKDFCESQGIDGYPTIYVYENGKKHEEYLGNHEVNEMFTYVQEQVARYKSEEIVEEVVTVYVEEDVYQQESDENKPRKSNKEEAQNHQQEEQKPKPQTKKVPHQRNQQGKNKQPPKNNNNHQKREKNNNVKTKQPPKAPKRAPPKAAPPKAAPPKYDQKMPPKYGQNFPPKNYQRPPYPPKRPNVVVKATKKVFGLVESLITLAIILIVIYIIVRFKAIKSHSSYSKSKIPLYRDLTQEEKFMLHYS